ncbi:MAG: SDR family oxidoreductase [Flavobacteriales bacterium]|nr:SDR family oxidoreductase [Flavobacteriales bacterium]
MPAYLITGATGLVGSHLCCSLLSQGHRIFALRRPGASLVWFNRIAQYVWKLSEKVLRNLSWIDADFTLPGSLDEHLTDIDGIFHCAGMVSFKERDRKELYRVNVMGTANILEAIRTTGQNRPICHISSNSVFNGKDGQFVNEAFFHNRQEGGSYYGYSKYLAELEVEKARSEGMRICILNPAVIIGFSDPARSSGRLVGKLRSGIPLCPPGWISVVGVKDVCRAAMTLLAGEHFRGRYLCVSAGITYRELFRLAKSIQGSDGVPGIIPASLLRTGAGLLRLLDRFGMPLPLDPGLLISATQRVQYSSERLKALPFEFEPLRDTLAEAFAAYKRMEEAKKREDKYPP